jgi:diguanylate cyclase (GGDEF)-like protein
MNASGYKCSVLAVDSDPHGLAALTEHVSGDFEVHTANSVEQARIIVGSKSIDILLTNLDLADESGLLLLEWVRRTSPQTSRVLLTATDRLEQAVDAINRTPIHRLVLKPCRPEDLLMTLHSAARALLLERSYEQVLNDLRQLNVDLEQRVADRTRELEIALAQVQQKSRILEQMALTDPLTQVANRRAIDLIARKELLRRTRMPRPLAIGLIDADHFKEINTRHLQTGGDHTLAWLAKTLNDAIRASDSFGRVGGEEFMVVAPDTNAAGATVLAERLRARVEQGKTEYGGAPIQLTVSIGFAVADSTTPAGYDQLREAAAGSLKEAKETGRNRCVVRTLKPQPPA